MKFIGKISKMGEDYFIRIPRDVRNAERMEYLKKDLRWVVEVREALE